MKTRINGIPINLKELTAYELEALMKMVEKRHDEVHEDLDKLNTEAVRRSQNSIPGLTEDSNGSRPRAW